MRKVFLC